MIPDQGTSCIIGLYSFANIKPNNSFRNRELEISVIVNSTVKQAIVENPQNQLRF